MKRFLLSLLVLVFYSCGGGGAATSSGPGNREVATSGSFVYIMNESSLVDNAEVSKWIGWQQQQIDNEFGNAWGIHVTLILADAPTSDSLQVHIIDDHPNGYQGFRSPGHMAYINMTQSLAKGTPSVTFSHEILGMIADPNAEQAEDICDPVAKYGYQVGTTNLEPAQVADFTYPAYWSGGEGPLDWLGMLDANR